MMLKKQNYEFVLHTLAPVHIGSGVKATSKEFIQENGEYYFPEMDKLYLFLEKNYPESLPAFEQYLLDSGSKTNKRKSRLIDFLNDQRIKKRDFGGFKIKQNNLVKNLGEVSLFIRDGLGNRYIPGSSLKGAIRTILESEYFRGKQIPWGAKSGRQFDDIFNNIRVSDSSSIEEMNFSIVQRWNHAKGKDPKRMNIYREALLPEQDVVFNISVIGEEAIFLMDNLENMAEKHYLFYKEFFLDKGFDKKYIQDNTEAPIYLGVGSGIWTKTNIRQMNKEKIDRIQMKNKMKNQGVMKLTKYPTNIISKIVKTKDFYEMGKCNFEVKKKS